MSRELLPDWDHFYVLMKAMLHRVPCLLDAYPEKLTNAPEPFSPDGQWILGKAPEVHVKVIERWKNRMDSKSKQ